MSVVTWGFPYSGGDSSEVQDQLKGVQQVQATSEAFAAILAEVQDQLKGVQRVQANCYAFAAILADESVVTWGFPDSGGDSSYIQDRLKGVQQVQATNFAFAAILAGGSVLPWGGTDLSGYLSPVIIDDVITLAQRRFENEVYQHESTRTV